MVDIRVGDKVLCTKSCTCNCGMIKGKIYTVEEITDKLSNPDRTYFKVKELPEIDDGTRKNYTLDECYQPYRLEKIKKKELQLELF